MKRVIFLLPLVVYSSFSFASDQDKLTKWNNPVSKEIRQAHADKLAQTTYKEINVKDARVSNDISKVYPQIETKVTKDGSATRVVAEAVLNTDKEKVAKDWAKKLKTAAKYGKGVLGVAALGLLVDELMDAIDYVMGEDGEIKKRPTDETQYTSPNNIPAHHKYYYQLEANGKKYAEYYTDPQAYISAFLSKFPANTYSCSSVVLDPNYTTNGKFVVRCLYIFFNQYFTLEPTPIRNPKYIQGSEPQLVPATENDIKDAIKTKVLNNPEKKNLAKNIVKDSYARIWDDKGNSLEIRGDVSNKQKDIVSSDNPANDGHSTSTPTISDGKSGSGSSSSGSSSSGTTEGTSYNPDGSVASSSVTTTITTSTSTTNIEFELPAFCDWASTVCEWLDWTKKDDDLPAKDQSDLNVEVPFEEKNVSVSWGAQCPAPTYETVSLHGVTAQIKTTDFTYICDLDWLIKPFVIGFASISALFILFGFQRGGDD